VMAEPRPNQKCSKSKFCVLMQEVLDTDSGDKPTGFYVPSILNLQTGKFRNGPPSYRCKRPRKPATTYMFACCPFCGFKYPEAT
jgi:hypothetical protein